MPSQLAIDPLGSSPIPSCNWNSPHRGQEFFELKEKILVCERILLQALAFDLSVEHAYRPLLAYVKSIKGTRDLAQIAWNFINDSLRTTVCLQYAPRCLAAAAADLAAKYIKTDSGKGFALPDTPQGQKWYHAFQATEEVIADISSQILEMYESNKPGQAANPSSSMLNAASLSSLMSQSRGALSQRAAGCGSDAAANAPASAPASAAPPTASSSPASAVANSVVKSEPESSAAPAATAPSLTPPAKPVSTPEPAPSADPVVKSEVAAPTHTPITTPAVSTKREGGDMDDARPDAKRSRPD